MCLAHGMQGSSQTVCAALCAYGGFLSKLLKPSRVALTGMMASQQQGRSGTNVFVLPVQQSKFWEGGMFSQIMCKL